MHTNNLHLPPIYPILDATTLSQRNIAPDIAAEALIEAGARILQYRHKDHWTRDTYAQATRLAALCHHAAVTLVINDRADYAALLRLTHPTIALHLGQDDLTPADARKILGADAPIGFSTHNPAQMEAAQAEPINYVAFGPIFTTASKLRPDPTVGTDLLRHIRTLTKLPLVAIGGITRDNAISCWNSGADSVAVIADMLPLSCSKQAIRDRMTEWQLLTRR